MRGEISSARNLWHSRSRELPLPGLPPALSEDRESGAQNPFARRHSARGAAECLRANGFCAPLSRSSDSDGGSAGRGNSRARECERFGALEISSCNKSEDVETGNAVDVN